VGTNAATAETQSVGWLGNFIEWVLPCCPEALHSSGSLATGEHEVLLTCGLCTKRRSATSGVGSCCWMQAVGLWSARWLMAPFDTDAAGRSPLDSWVVSGALTAVELSAPVLLAIGLDGSPCSRACPQVACSKPDWCWQVVLRVCLVANCEVVPFAAAVGSALPIALNAGLSSILVGWDRSCRLAPNDEWRRARRRSGRVG